MMKLWRILFKPRTLPEPVLYTIVAAMLVLGAWGFYALLRAPGDCERAGGTYFTAARGGVCVKVIDGKPTRIDP